MPRGRPFGGLEMYVSKHLKGTLVSSSPHHIAVSTANSISVIGVYYSPALDFDDVFSDLTQALLSCPENGRIILGGDFNLKNGTEEFKILQHLLDSYNINLRSNPDCSTYTHAKGSSTPDHVFLSRDLVSPKCTVTKLCASPHEGLNVTFKVPARRRDKSYLEPVVRKVLDPVLCAKNLDEISRTIELAPQPLWAQKVSHAFSSASRTLKPKKDRKKPWFSEYHRDL